MASSDTPKLNPSTLPDDIYRVLSDTTDHEVSEDNVEKAGEAFKNLLRTRLTKRREVSGDEVIRFSSLGKKDRQIWYAAKNTPGEVLPPKTIGKFLFGDIIEILLLFLAKEAGHEVTHEQYEVEEDGILGHIDAMIDGIPVDVKSASPYSFQKFENQTYKLDDPFGYLPQLAGYAHKMGKTDRAGFLVMDKVHGDIAFAELDEYDIQAYPPGPRIEALREAISSSIPPARCYADVPEGKSGNRKLGIGCSYCRFKDTCWADSNGGKGLRKFYYSRGPVWLTEVKKEPKVDEA